LKIQIFQNFSNDIRNALGNKRKVFKIKTLNFNETTIDSYRV